MSLFASLLIWKPFSSYINPLLCVCTRFIADIEKVLHQWGLAASDKHSKDVLFVLFLLNECTCIFHHQEVALLNF